MDVYIYKLIKDLSEKDLTNFVLGFELNSKKPVTAFAWCTFFGWVGGHKYYMKKFGLGILYTLFFWTTIPMFISIIELFFISNSVTHYNRKLANKLLNNNK